MTACQRWGRGESPVASRFWSVVMARAQLPVRRMFCMAGLPSAVRADEPMPTLNPYGHRVGEMTDQPARIYVWYDEDAGWQLRSAATRKGAAKFEGSVRAVGGQFRRCRPIGLDQRGKSADHWALDEKRETLTFALYTAGSFDGFDFTVVPPSATLEFHLTISGRERPQRIFVGLEDHPLGTFQLPAAPSKKPMPAESAGRWWLHVPKTGRNGRWATGSEIPLVHVRIKQGVQRSGGAYSKGR